MLALSLLGTLSESTLLGWLPILLSFAVGLVSGWGAKSASDTYRLESTPRLTATVGKRAAVFTEWDGIFFCELDGVLNHVAEAKGLCDLSGEPLYLIDTKLGGDGLRLIANGITLREPAWIERKNPGVHSSPIWAAIRFEIKNLGRTAAVQVELSLLLSVVTFGSQWRENMDRPPHVTMSDEAKVVVTDVAACGSASFWIANTLGSICTVQISSKAKHLDPRKSDARKKVAVTIVAPDAIQLASMDRSIILGPSQEG